MFKRHAFLVKAQRVAYFTGDGRFDYYDLAELADYRPTDEPHIRFAPAAYNGTIVDFHGQLLVISLLANQTTTSGSKVISMNVEGQP